VRIWDPTTEEEVSKLDIDGSAVLALAWSPDGTLIAAGTRKGVVKVIDAETGEITQTIQVSPQGVPMGAISWSSDSSTFVAALYQGPVNPGDISLWDALTGEEVEGGAIRRNYTAPGPTGVAYSPYDDTIAWPNNNNLGQVSLYTVDDDKNSVMFVGQNKVASIAWSSDGSLIATGGADHMVFIWDPLDGTALTQLKGHRDTITTVCWSSDDTFIVSVSADGIIKVWGTPLE
jgi:WD40 repeat protein